MLQDRIFTSQYEPYKASRNLVGTYCCGQVGSEIRFLTATGKLIDIIGDVTGDYDRQRAQWEYAALSCSRVPLHMDEQEAESFCSKPLPLAEEFQRVAKKFVKFDQPPTMLIATGSNNPNSDFYNQKSTLESVIRENEMKCNEYRTGDSIWDVYITTLIADRSSNVQSSDCTKTSDVLNLLKACRLAKRWTYTDLTWSTALRKRIPESVSKKALLTSETRYLGLGPEFARTGGLLVILNGLNVPLVLRKAENENMYTVIGEACKIQRPL